MKKILFFSGVVFMALITAATNAQEKAGTLRVSVDGFKNSNGVAMIALCNSVECFKKSDKPFLGTMAPIKDGKSEWIVTDLVFGTYSISVYHDQNSNGKLDTNALGIPKEKYGFSNNARGMFGPPKFEEARFEFNKSEMTVNITVK